MKLRSFAVFDLGAPRDEAALAVFYVLQRCRPLESGGAASDTPNKQKHLVRYPGAIISVMTQKRAFS